MRWLFACEALMGFLVLKYVWPPLLFPLAGVGNLVLVLLIATGVVGRLLRRQGENPAQS
jgi:hypothetical protein